MSRGGPTGAAAVALLVLLALAGCRRGPEPVLVSSVRVAEGGYLEPLREAGLERPEVEKVAREALAGSGFALGEGERAHRARLDVVGMRVAPAAGTGGTVVEVAVELELAPPGGQDPLPRRETGSAMSPLTGVRPVDAWTTALADATREAAETLALGFAGEGKTVPQLLADLGSQDPRAREVATRILAERRSPEAVPALLERLQDPDPEVVERAVGALAQIRDPRAVGPLVDVSRRGDGAFTARIARILGDLGGREAEAYLLVLESGHPDARVRRAAGEALADMRARSAEAARATAGK